MREDECRGSFPQEMRLLRTLSAAQIKRPSPPSSPKLSSSLRGHPRVRVATKSFAIGLGLLQSAGFRLLTWPRSVIGLIPFLGFREIR